MSVYIRDLSYSVERGAGYEIGARGLNRNIAPSIRVEMTLLTDDTEFVRLLQDVMARGGRFEEIVIALARQSMLVDDEYGAGRAPTLSQAASKAAYEERRAREAAAAMMTKEPALAKSKIEETIEAMGYAIGVDPAEIAKYARELGVLPSPALADPPKKKPEPPPKPTRMGGLEFDDDEKEKK